MDQDNLSPHSLEAALEQGLALRRRGAPKQALELMNRLCDAYPKSGRLHQERGACYRMLDASTEAIAAFTQAVALNDTLIESWQALQELAEAFADAELAAKAKLCLERLNLLPPILMNASSLLNEGDLEHSERLVREFLQGHGAHIQGMRILAQIGIKRDVLDDAEFLLKEIVEMDPDYHDARYEYGAVLTKRRRYLLAVQQARRLLTVEPKNENYLTLYAEACDGLGEYEEALRIYRWLAAEDPANAEHDVAVAHILKTLGSTADAIEKFKSAVMHPATAANALYGLANMKTFRFADGEIAVMRELEASTNVSLIERYRLCFGLGKALEDARNFEESFHYYARGNALRSQELRYRPDIMERNLQLQASICTPEFFAARRGFGCPHPDPIFIVGLPRSGSTLIEQILASHSQIDGTHELPEIPRLVRQFRNRSMDDEMPRYPGLMSDMAREDFLQLGLEYLRETQVYRRGAPFFVDKMPSNFRDIGFIHLILPNAKIIDARREPMACCFGNFKQLFANGQEFTYDLANLGRYYRNYIRLMDHWNRALPRKILRVQHEDLVFDLEGTVRRLLEFCGVAFEPSCLEFYKTVRSVRTVSSEQVRTPIYRQGLDQWRNFEPWLSPLKAALSPLA